MRLHTKAEKVLVAFMVFASAIGFAQSAAASEDSDTRVSGVTISQGIRAYMEQRICDHYARVRIGRPYVSRPLFCDAGRKPAVDLTVSPMTIASGQSAVLTWASTRANTCTVSGGWSGSRMLSGTETVAPATTTTYAILCVNAYGIASDSVILTVATSSPQPTLTLIASPGGIVNGATSTLSWSSSNASTCTASGGWGGNRPLSGTSVVSPATTTAYVLSCTGLGGTAHATTTVTVTSALQPVVSLSANPTTIVNGATSTLSWNSANASSCGARVGWSGARSLSGATVISPATTTTYVLDCFGLGGTTTATTTVIVSPAPNPQLTFSADMLIIDQGATSTLNWSSMHTTACTAQGGWSGGKALNGSQIVTPSATTTYVLVCTGLGGTAYGTTTVDVRPATSTALFSSSVLMLEDSDALRADSVQDVDQSEDGDEEDTGEANDESLGLDSRSLLRRLLGR